MFEDYLKAYDFWGHCDIDLLWGNIRKFITDDLLQKYQRIHTRGHCCIYMNTPEVNSWYRMLPSLDYQNWKRVFETKESYCFDEWGGHCGGGISQIISANGIDVYDEADMADLDVTKGCFKINRCDELKKFRDLYFYYDRGSLYVCRKKERLKEFLYVHFQKRNLEIKLNLTGCFYLIAPGIVINDSTLTQKRNLIRKCSFSISYYQNKCKTYLRKHLQRPLDIVDA